MSTIRLREEFRELLNIINTDFDRLEQLENLKTADFESFVSNLDALYKKGIVFSYTNSITEHSTINELQKDKPVVVENSMQFSDLLKDAEEKQSEKQTLAIVNEAIVESIVTEVNIVTDLKEEDNGVLNSPIVEVQATHVKSDEIKKENVLNLVDIKSGIGINDKFQFISELFANNADLYENAIKTLNADLSLQASLLTFEQIKKENNWKDESEVAQRLLEVVKRRFL